MTHRQMSRADLIAGVLFFVLAVATVYGSWTMDRLEVRQIFPLSAPGLLPGLLGLALALTSALLILKSLKKEDAANSSAAPPPEPRTEEDRRAPVRLALALALCFGYALGLVGLLPFWLATATFVAAFILVFEWTDADSPRRLSTAAWAVGIGLVTGLSTAYAFSEIFLVRLP